MNYENYWKLLMVAGGLVMLMVILATKEIIDIIRWAFS